MAHQHIEGHSDPSSYYRNIFDVVFCLFDAACSFEAVILTFVCIINVNYVGIFISCYY